MYAIIFITAVIFLVSLYEFASTRNWQQVTSSTRNEVVFEGRNKAYGAYQIRRDYDRTFLLILLGLMGSVGIAYGAFVWSQTSHQQITTVPMDDFENDPTIHLSDRENPPITTPPVDRPVQQPAAKTEQVIEPTPTDQPVETTLNTQDQLEQTTVSSVTNQGNGTGFTAPVGPTTTTVPVIDPAPDAAIEEVDVDATFPGGYAEMMRFLSANIRYPQDVLEMGGEGRVVLRFVVDREGNIEQIAVVRGVRGFESLDAEALRVVKQMPKWTPAQLKGRAVKSYFTLPIYFQIN